MSPKRRREIEKATPCTWNRRPAAVAVPGDGHVDAAQKSRARTPSVENGSGGESLASHARDIGATQDVRATRGEQSANHGGPSCDNLAPGDRDRSRAGGRARGDQVPLSGGPADLRRRRPDAKHQTRPRVFAEVPDRGAIQRERVA